MISQGMKGVPAVIVLLRATCTVTDIIFVMELIGRQISVYRYVE
ncbi:hypothetical protein [Virgibacillus kimchii]